MVSAGVYKHCFNLHPDFPEFLPCSWGDIKEYLIKVLTLGGPMLKTTLSSKALDILNRNF